MDNQTQLTAYLYTQSLLLFYFLLSYNSCTGRYIVTLHMCLQYILDSPPPSFSLICSFPLLEQFHQVSLFCLHTQIQNTYCPLSPFPDVLPYLTSTHPWPRPVLSSCPLLKNFLLIYDNYTGGLF
jgi:hypothetical protein